MNSLISYSERDADSATDSGIQPPTLASVAPDERNAANDDGRQPGVDHAVNPLWMITVGLGLLLGVLALFVATG